MKEIEREIIDNSTNSPRFKALKECMDKWLELYQEEDDDEGIDMILLGWDKKYKHAIQFSLCDSGPLNVQDIQHILEYAFEFGYQDSTEITGSELNGITVNDYLLWNANVYSVLRMYDIVRDCKTDFVYVGYGRFRTCGRSSIGR